MMQHHPKHYCGVFSIFGHPNAAQVTYLGLYALQHRGQESAGIVTCHGNEFLTHKGMGLVSQVFKGNVLKELPVLLLLATHVIPPPGPLIFETPSP